MRTTVFGAGYVGLVQAAVLADVGHQVVCADIDAKKVEHLRQGDVPIYEPGLEALIKSNVAAGRLSFTTDAKDAIEHGSLLFIAVGTPPEDDGSADIRHVLSVADTIARHMDQEKIVVVKSTVPVGTCDLVSERLRAGLKQRKSKLAVSVASNPEFLKEGSAVGDCMRPDRIIIGAENSGVETALREIYAPFNRNHEKIITMDVRDAELTKYASNCMLATKISFMNEMADLADRLGVDIENVRKGIGADPRIGFHFIYPGVGYGGSCFPKDARALIHTAEQVGLDAVLLKAVEDRNSRQKLFLFEKLMKRFGGNIRGRTFAIWGLAFKPNTDDMREAPARPMIESIWAEGGKVQAFDPKANEECKRIYGERADLKICANQNEALEGADALILMTEWRNFQAPDFEVIKAALKEALIFDGRNVYDPKSVAQKGLELFSVGRPSAASKT